jgi:anti-sigma B factor antagonist
VTSAVPDPPATLDPYIPFQCFVFYIDPARAAVLVQGELDLVTAPHLCSELNEVLAKPIEHVTVDVGDVTFMDSSGLAALIGAHAQATQTGIELVLAHVSRQVRLVIEAAGLDELFRLRPLET